MNIIGLTGSIGMGKSAAARRFRELGVPVFDADAEVHKLYATAAVAPIEAAFPGTTGPAGVDRQKLMTILLADPSGFKRLEQIVHPLVQAAQRDFIRTCFRENKTATVLEIPLLFETGGEKKVDITVVVSTTAEQQKQRVLERPGMTEKKLMEILSRQMPDAEKRRRADFVVDTSMTLAATDAQIDHLLASISSRVGQAYEQHWQ